MNLGMFTFFPPNSKWELLLHSLSLRSKPGRRTATCRNRHGTHDYLLSLGLGLTEAFPLAAICHFWWLVKSGHVSVRRLRSQKWLKRFFLERSATGHFFQTASLAASCPASKTPETSVGDICMKFGCFTRQTNAPWKVFCFTLCCLEWIKGTAKRQSLQRETVLWNNACHGDISS